MSVNERKEKRKEVRADSKDVSQSQSRSRDRGGRSRSPVKRRHKDDLRSEVDYLGETVNEIYDNLDILEIRMQKIVEEKLAAVIMELKSFFGPIAESVKSSANMKQGEHGITNGGHLLSINQEGISTASSVQVAKPPDTSKESQQSPAQHEGDKQTDEMEWIEVTKGKKTKFSKNSQDTRVNNMNRYESLNSLVEEESSASQRAENPYIKPKSVKSAYSKNDKANVVNKVTPIITYNMNQKTMKNDLLNKNMKDFKFLRGRNPDRVVVLPSSKETRSAALSILAEKGIKHYTYTPRDERSTPLVIKKIPSEYILEDVKEELDSLGWSNKISKVTRIETDRLARFNFFLIHVLPGVPLGEFLKTKWMFNTGVKIEKFIHREEPQCYKCQRTGHFASGCEMGSRCVKCALDHHSSECTLSKETDKNLLKCVLCNQMGHPASYRGCPKFKEIVKNKKLKQAQAENSVQFDSKFVEKGTSFSSFLQPSKKISASNPSCNINELLNSASEELFGCDYAQLKSSFDIFWYTYKNEKDPKIKKQALLNFILITNYNG